MANQTEGTIIETNYVIGKLNFGFGVSSRFVTGFLIILVSTFTTASEYVGEIQDKKVAYGFARCAAYYSLKATGERNLTTKERYRAIYDSNFAFSVSFSSIRNAQSAVIEERQKLINDIRLLEKSRLGEYGQGITVQCAELMVERMPQLESLGFVFK